MTPLNTGTNQRVFEMKESIRQTAINTIELEFQAIKGLIPYINEEFEKAVAVIRECTGRLVISGIGKSAIIAQKIVATFNSTGTGSIFMHAADAIHGDLGMVHQNDVVMIISKSGETPEIKLLLPLVKNFGNPVIGITGNASSFLATRADIFLNTTVEQEACPNNLAPTTSTTAQLVMGDALAVCLMKTKGFDSDDFAKFHPGGTLGKKLYLRVSDIFIKNEKPKVKPEQSLKEVIVEISSKRLGATAVVGPDDILLGLITDGDLRRMLENTTSLEAVIAGDVMTKNPRTIGANELAVDALDKMRSNSISQLVVTEGDKYLGFIHLHDLIREGLI